MNRIDSIGVFDSGIGGLSILQALRAHLPNENFIYYADSAHHPYGAKHEAFVQQRSLNIACELIEQRGCKLLVVACNTATAAAIGLLRDIYPQTPIVGIEPALKPAAKLTRTGHVAVLATQGTLLSAKFAALKNSLESSHIEFHCIPCEGLAERIEHLAQSHSESLDATDLIALCAGYLPGRDPFGSKNGQIDTMVLGCTHYPLILPVWRRLVPAEVQIVDNAKAVAQRVANLLDTVDRAASLNRTGQITWVSSANVQDLEATARYWFRSSLNLV